MLHPEAELLTPALGLRRALLLLVSGAVGALLAVLLVPVLVPGLAGSLAGPSPKGYWYLSRAAGLAAYLLLWLSVVLGLLVSSKLSRLWPGGPTAVDLHQFSSVLGLAFSLFHALILLGDRYIRLDLAQLVLPFGAAPYRPLETGLGQLAFYLGVLVAFSFYVRRFIGYRVWRLLHHASFATYLLATLHGLTAGTDSLQPAVLAIYGSTTLSTYFLLVYRLLTAVPQPRRVTR
jgi:predicted ferric reductase